MKNTPENNSLALVAEAWKHAPHRLVSLWDMIRAISSHLVLSIRNLKTYEVIFGKHHGGEELRHDDRQSILAFLTTAMPHFTELRMSDTLSRIRSLKMRLLGDPGLPGCTYQIILAEMQAMRRAACNELCNMEFVFIPKDNAKMLEQDDLFGSPDAPFANKASKAINAEIKAAGNCLALDLNNAAVFHLMRAAEHGLHALANHLLPNQSINPYPLEFSEWGKVISAIETALREGKDKVVGKMSPGPAKDLESEFHDGLLRDVNYFKIAYRNPVSHLRGDYTDNQALGVRDKVKEFMLRLATRVPLK